MLRASVLFLSPGAPWVAAIRQRRHASYKNYYEVLKVKRNCSNEEIRKAYIVLSKELHPDLNPNDPTSHSKIVQVNEAYKVLGKPSSRRLYDAHLRSPATVPLSRSSRWDIRPSDTTSGWNWYQSSAWGSQRREDVPYYGIKGIKRVPTKWIAFGCVVIALFSGGIQLFSLRYRQVHVSQERTAREEQLAAWWLEARQRAEESGSREAQMEMFERRLAEANYCPLCAEEAANEQ